MWVFGYGSLIWNPGFAHQEAQAAILHGYHRRFCVASHRYRGTEACPGLVLGLDRGGSCRGMAFRAPADSLESILDYLWDREMVTGVYRPSRLSARIIETDPQGGRHLGRRITVTTFVVRRDHRQYAGHLDPAETAAIIHRATGNRGPCRDYLHNTIIHLATLGLRDRALADLKERVDQLSRELPSENPAGQ